jgi:hypothetical protein
MHVVYVHFLVNLIELLFVESIAQLLYVRLQTGVSINAVHDAVVLDEFRAYFEYFGYFLLCVGQMFSKIACKNALF